jgi:REP element-mobilizing transposase RayT
METYALTTATLQRRGLFVRTANALLLIDTLFHYRDQGRYRLHGFAVMPEHLHVPLTPSESQSIERCAQCIKGGFSHAGGRNLAERCGRRDFTSTAYATKRTIGGSSDTLRRIPKREG